VKIILLSSVDKADDSSLGQFFSHTLNEVDNSSRQDLALFYSKYAKNQSLRSFLNSGYNRDRESWTIILSTTLSVLTNIQKNAICSRKRR
jgi:hypothetical protein